MRYYVTHRDVVKYFKTKGEAREYYDFLIAWYGCQFTYMGRVWKAN